jgi:two-component system sensor histidine kinase SenX3
LFDGRRRLEEQLAASERAAAAARDEATQLAARLAMVSRALDGVPQGVVVCDEDGREVVRNAAAAAFTEARHAEALVERAVEEELLGALAGASRRRELDLFGPPARMLVITAEPLDGGGAVAVVDDVSERRRVDAVRRDFVANISHELKTPVGALAVLAEALGAEEEPAVARRLAARLTGEADRLARIIDDLLVLSRIEVDMPTELQRLQVRDVVREAIGGLLPVADARNITLDASEVGDEMILGDARQVIVALSNLLENACKYSDEGAAVFVRSTRDGDAVTIGVEDRGIGIPSKDLDRVFERFYRVDAARSRATGGTGLGLSIVRHVAANHGGSVTVQSAEGVGSTFTLRLPAADA